MMLCKLDGHLLFSSRPSLVLFISSIRFYCKKKEYEALKWATQKSSALLVFCSRVTIMLCHCLILDVAFHQMFGYQYGRINHIPLDFIYNTSRVWETSGPSRHNYCSSRGIPCDEYYPNVLRRQEEWGEENGIRGSQIRTIRDSNDRNMYLGIESELMPANRAVFHSLQGSIRT